MDDILVLDDNSTDREQIVRALDGKPFILHLAQTASEALQICNDFPISIALIDYVLGTDNGIEIFEDLSRARPFLRGILISGYMDYGLLTHIVESRFDDCLNKPIDGDLLYESLMNSMRMIIHWRARFKEYKRSSACVLSQNNFLTEFSECVQEIDFQTYVVQGKYLIENNLLDALVAREWDTCVYLCVDLSDVKSIHSMIIGSLVALKNAVKKSGGDVGLYGMSSQVLSVMKSLRLFELFYGSDDKDEIIKKMQG